jgi:hypothetical protein
MNVKACSAKWGALQSVRREHGSTELAEVSVSRSQHNASSKWRTALVPRHEIYHWARHDGLFSAAMLILRHATIVYSLP